MSTWPMEGTLSSASSEASWPSPAPFPWSAGRTLPRISTRGISPSIPPARARPSLPEPPRRIWGRLGPRAFPTRSGRSPCAPSATWKSSAPTYLPSPPEWIKQANRVEGLASRWASPETSQSIASWTEAIEALADGADPSSLDYASLLAESTPGGLHFLRALSASLRLPGVSEAFSLALGSLTDERLEHFANLPDAAGCTLGMSFFESARSPAFVSLSDEEPLDRGAEAFSALAARLGPRLALSSPSLSALGLLLSGSTGAAASYSFQSYPAHLPETAPALVSIAWRHGLRWDEGIRAPFAFLDASSSNKDLRCSEPLDIPDPERSLDFLLGLPCPDSLRALLEARMLSLRASEALESPPPARRAL